MSLLKYLLLPKGMGITALYNENIWMNSNSRRLLVALMPSMHVSNAYNVLAVE